MYLEFNLPMNKIIDVTDYPILQICALEVLSFGSDSSSPEDPLLPACGSSFYFAPFFALKNNKLNTRLPMTLNAMS